MPYQNAHVKVTIFGTFGNGIEEWSTGFRMGQEGDNSGNFGIGAGWLAEVGAAWQTFFTGPSHGFGTMWRTDGIKAAIILPTGKTDVDNVETYSYGSPIQGQGATNNFPPQVSLVAQLAASSNVGLGSKGRMYLPGIAFGLQEQGGISTTQAQNVANGLRTFLDAAENATNAPGYVINASKGRPGVPFTAPVNRRVTRVRVGTIYDTQRRRRNGLAEQYSEAALAA